MNFLPYYWYLVRLAVLEPGPVLLFLAPSLVLIPELSSRQ